MSDEIIGLLGYLLEDHDFTDHPRGEARAKTFLDDLKSHGYEIVPGWSDDFSKAPRDGTSVDLYVRNPYSGAGYRIPDCRWSPEGCWAYVGDHKTFQHIDDSWITHWRPRPTPPKVSE